MAADERLKQDVWILLWMISQDCQIFLARLFHNLSQIIPCIPTVEKIIP